MRVLEEDKPIWPPDPVAYAALSLSVRALTVSHEICALLRAGFPQAAMGRWRTLYEVNVVAAVLGVGNRHTATRLNEHRWIMLARDRRHADGEATWPHDGPTPEEMQERLVRRFGPTYTGRYGWAAEVTRRRLGVAKPQFHHLEKVAALGGRSDRHLAAHHRVHADALGTWSSSPRTAPGTSVLATAG
ncbi:DUF5677 domain-containing protein [Nocardioides daphniae]